MDKEIILAIEYHKLWVDSFGKAGKQIYLEEKLIERGEWKNINLSQGSIIDCTFRQMIIKNWDFYAARLCSSCFEEVMVRSGEFVKADLSYTQFFNTKIEASNFSKSDLSNTVFDSVEIVDCKFVNALLDSVFWGNSNLRYIDFAGALIENVLFDKDTILNGIHGLDNAHIKSINIGTAEQPIYIKEQEAAQWLKHRISN